MFFLLLVFLKIIFHGRKKNIFSKLPEDIEYDDCDWAKLGCLWFLSCSSISDEAHKEYPDTDFGIFLTRDPKPTWTGCTIISWPDFELFLTRIIFEPHTRHFRGKSLAATASWIVWTKQSLHSAWWLHGATCMTARAAQQMTHWNTKGFLIKFWWEKEKIGPIK